MPLEVAAVKIGFAIMSHLRKAWLGKDSLASAVGDSVSSMLEDKAASHFNQRKFNRFIEDCADVIARRLLRSLTIEFQAVPDNEIEAAILAVSDTLREADVQLGSVLNSDFNPKAVENSLQPTAKRILRGSALSEGASSLYQYILSESCEYIVHAATTLPSFNSETSIEILRRQTAIIDQLTGVLDRLPDRRSTVDFATDYARQVSTLLDRMELFGVRLHEKNRNYPLNVAYLGLSARLDAAAYYEPRRARDIYNNKLWLILRSGQSFRISDAVGHIERTILIGGAGSGKTTLLKWLAVHCARRDFAGDLTRLNYMVPFFLPLRRYVGRSLPRPEDFLDSVGRFIVADMPAGWVHNILRRGNGLVLIDGLDEMPSGQRAAARTWLEELIVAFPNSRYVVTSRPGVVSPNWDELQFISMELQPMTSQDILAFINHWYDAARVGVRSDLQQVELRHYEERLLVTLEGDRHLRMLAVSPLLCALLCALNRELRTKLPRSRMEVYESALTMLLEQRDRERGLESALDLSRTEKTVLLQGLAIWLIRNGKTTASVADFRHSLEDSLSSLRRPEERPSAEAVMEYLIERSGLLRQPVIGEVDFIHKTFQEYLAGKAAMDDNAVGELCRNALDDQWREVIILAAGHARPQQCANLLQGLLERGDNKTQVRILIAACMRNAVALDSDVRQMVESEIRELMPPRTVEMARVLAQAGDFVLDLLPTPRDSTEGMAIIETARIIGGPDALNVISRVAGTPSVGEELHSNLVSAWKDFPGARYVSSVLAKLDWTGKSISNPSSILDLAPLCGLQGISYQGELGLLADLESKGIVLESVERLHVTSSASSRRPHNVGALSSSEIDKVIAECRQRKEQGIDNQDFELAANERDIEKFYLEAKYSLGTVISERLMPGLVELTLSSFIFTDLAWLPRAQQVVRLVLEDLRLNALREFPVWSTLKEISFRECNVEDSDLTPLSLACSRLEEIFLDFGTSARINLSPLSRLNKLFRLPLHRARWLIWEGSSQARPSRSRYMFLLASRL
jgi:NACHT domain